MWRQYQSAYREATGLPLTLRAAGSWLLPFHGKPGENAFCALMAGKSHTCAVCLQLQGKLTQAAMDRPATRTCAYGLCETAVPVKLGSQTIGFLQTGQVMRRKPTGASFKLAVREAGRRGVDIGNEETKRAYFKTPVVSQRKLDSLTDLLAIFAEHLAMRSNQIVVQTTNLEPPCIVKAKQFIREHCAEEVSLGQVSSIVRMSRFYFCKRFRQTTGLSFTGFVARTRVEKAKDLLLNPNLRVSEVAFEVGFQSLTHFNRMFKKIMGQSPSEYRGRLAGAV